MDIVTLSMAKAYSDKKGGYIAKNKNFIITGDTKNFVASEETGGLPIHLYGVSLGHPSCFRCDVTWDGKEYICSVTQNEDALYVGNNAIIGFGDDTGEPFLIISDFNKNTTLMVATEAGEHSFSLCEYYETIVPIDPKFLPGVCLPLLNSVFELGPESELLDEKVYEIPADFMAELSTKPYAFMARCVCESVDGTLMTTTAMFLPIDLGGIVSGWNAVVSFGTTSSLYIVTVAQMGEQMICQVRKNT